MRFLNAVAFLSIAATAAGEPQRFLRTMTEPKEPSQHLFPLLHRYLKEDVGANHQRSLIFFQGGGEDITNLPKDVDRNFRLFVLAYDLALFPYWYPLILAGETGGAGYDDLFACVFGTAPFIPCLNDNSLIGPDQYDCYVANGLAQECIMLGNPFSGKLSGSAQADELLNETAVPGPSGNSTRNLLVDAVSSKLDRLLSDEDAWNNQIVNFNPHDAMKALGFDRALQQVSEDFFTGSDINNPPKTEDFLARLIVLSFDLALAPLWLPLIKIGATGGATYQDLFFCVFDQGPFIPCLKARNLISQEQFDCFQTNGLTWSCLILENSLFQKFAGSPSDQLLAELYNETEAFIDFAGNSTRKLYSERSLHVTRLVTAAYQRDMESDMSGGVPQWIPDVVSCLLGPAPYDKCILDESLYN